MLKLFFAVAVLLSMTSVTGMHKGFTDEEIELITENEKVEIELTQEHKEKLLKYQHDLLNEKNNEDNTKQDLGNFLIQNLINNEINIEFQPYTIMVQNNTEKKGMFKNFMHVV